MAAKLLPGANASALRCWQRSRAPAGYAAMQKLADDVALASYLANDLLVEDVLLLQRWVAERDTVEATLQRALAEEQASPVRAPNSNEQKATRDRIQQIQGSLVALTPSYPKADHELVDYQKQLDLAGSEYVQALNAILAAFTPPTQPSAVAAH